MGPIRHIEMRWLRYDKYQSRIIINYIRRSKIRLNNHLYVSSIIIEIRMYCGKQANTMLLSEDTLPDTFYILKNTGSKN